MADVATPGSVGGQGSSPVSVAALLLADSRLPVGGHTVSGGLEPALMGGMDEASVAEFIAVRLATVTRAEAGVAVVAAGAVRGLGDLEETATPTADDVAWAWATRNPVPAVRESAVSQGRALMRLVRRLRPNGLAEQWLSTLPAGLTARPVVLGALAGELGLTGVDIARLVAYDDVQSVAGAALKLLPMDPLDAAAWALDASDAVDSLVGAVAHLADPEDIPARAAPQLDEWHVRHAVSERRLFRV